MSSDSPVTTKQQRDARRAATVAALKKQQRTEQRTSRIGWIVGGSLGAIALAAIVTLVVVSAIPKQKPADVAIEGVKAFQVQAGVHVDAGADVDPANPPTVDYKTEFGMNPPAGGPHWSAWLNCGVYTQPQQNERAVHALEHGAIWVTYNPDELSADDITTLQNSVPSTYMVVSPYPGLQAPIVASAWGYQVELEGVDDPRLDLFITKYRESPDGPEFGAACTGAVDGPGKIA
ncbi:MAG: DUF3105 domain-containing protein [Microbacteriaceae bacterium]